MGVKGKEERVILAPDRQNQILKIVLEKKVATVSELAEHFNVHEATIRRDLSALEQLGKLRRTHGGVMIADGEVHSEPPFQERESAQYDEKKRIGEFSGRFINDGDNIVLDSGTTTVHVVDSIMKRKNVTVITNDINIAAKLRFSTQNKVIVTGGNLFPESYMLNGMLTDSALNKMYVQTAFIATPAFHPELGLSHFDDYLIPAKKNMIKCAKKVVLLADHTKIGKVSLHKVTGLEKIDVLITGKEVDDQLKHYLEDAPMKVYFV